MHECRSVYMSRTTEHNIANDPHCHAEKQIHVMDSRFELVDEGFEAHGMLRKIRGENVVGTGQQCASLRNMDDMIVIGHCTTSG